MKKTYKTPNSRIGTFLPDTICQPGIAGSTTSTEGNLGKERNDYLEEEEEIDEAIIMLLRDREENNISNLW